MGTNVRLNIYLFSNTCRAENMRSRKSIAALGTLKFPKGAKCWFAPGICDKAKESAAKMVEQLALAKTEGQHEDTKPSLFERASCWLGYGIFADAKDFRGWLVDLRQHRDRNGEF